MLQNSGIAFTEFSGIEPNPKVTTVRKAIEQARKDRADAILLVGGGSTIDAAKVIAAGTSYSGDIWELVQDNCKLDSVLPVIAVSTISATGSEMDCYAVISNEETREKLYPKYAILNPEFTYTVPAYQTAAGTVDIMSHVLEVYFSPVPNTYMQDRIMEALLQTCIQYGPIAVRDPENYNARANLMWASEWAINGFIACGKPGPWPAHSIEHQISAYYDVTHGHGLAVLIPNIMRFMLNYGSISRLAEYGARIWKLSGALSEKALAEQAIEKTDAFFSSLGLSMRLSEMGIPNQENFEEMARDAAQEGLEE